MPLQNPASKAKWVFMDYTSKTSIVEINTNENLGVAGMAGQLEALQDLEDAFAGISGGTIVSQHFAPYITSYSQSAITNARIQRERVWTVVYTDTFNGEEGYATFPCARESTVGGSPIVSLDGLAIMTEPDWVAFKTAFEDVARSIHGNPVAMKLAYISDNNT
jgi:hypothetical protein